MELARFIIVVVALLVAWIGTVLIIVRALTADRKRLHDRIDRLSDFHAATEDPEAFMASRPRPEPSGVRLKEVTMDSA